MQPSPQSTSTPFFHSCNSSDLTPPCHPCLLSHNLTVSLSNIPLGSTFKIYSENVHFSLLPSLPDMYKMTVISFLFFFFGFLRLSCFPVSTLPFNPQLAGISFQNPQQIMAFPDLNFPVPSHPFWNKCQSSYSTL